MLWGAVVRTPEGMDVTVGCISLGWKWEFQVCKTNSDAYVWKNQLILSQMLRPWPNDVCRPDLVFNV